MSRKDMFSFCWVCEAGRMGLGLSSSSPQGESLPANEATGKQS